MVTKYCSIHGKIETIEEDENCAFCHKKLHKDTTDLHSEHFLINEFCSICRKLKEDFDKKFGM